MTRTLKERTFSGTTNPEIQQEVQLPFMVQAQERRSKVELVPVM